MVKTIVVWTKRDAQTLREVAEQHKIKSMEGVQALVQRNRGIHPTITSCARLKKGTALLLELPDDDESPTVGCGINISALCSAKKFNGGYDGWKKIDPLELTYMKKNLRQEGTESAKRYNEYKGAKTLSEYKALFRKYKARLDRPRNNTSAASSVFKWDVLAGYVKGPAVDMYLTMLVDKEHTGDKRHVKHLKRLAGGNSSDDSDYKTSPFYKEPTDEEKMLTAQRMDTRKRRKAHLDADFSMREVAVQQEEELDGEIQEEEELVFSETELDNVAAICDEVVRQSEEDAAQILACLGAPVVIDGIPIYEDSSPPRHTKDKLREHLMSLK